MKTKAKHNRSYETARGEWGTVIDGFLCLPLPPSINMAHRDIIIKGKRKDGAEYARPQRLLSKEGRTYKELATVLAACSGLPRIEGKVSLLVLVWGRGRMDLMNCEKLLTDSIKEILFEDDHRICEFTIRDCHPMLEGTLTGVAVKVEPFVPTLPSGNLFEEGAD